MNAKLNIFPNSMQVEMIASPNKNAFPRTGRGYNICLWTWLVIFVDEKSK